ncbi:MAG: thioredoxin [Dehalococcoidia bacterium]
MAQEEIMAHTVEVNDANFKQVVEDSPRPVLVDLWAPWCAPCLKVGPIVEELAREYDGKADFVKVNVDESPRVASTYGIQSIPTLLFFKGGKPMSQVVGLRSKEELKKNLDNLMG